MKTTEFLIDKSRRVCPLSEEIIKMLITQLAAELSNHNMYKSFANWFDVQGLSKLAKYFEGRAAEEQRHHDWIYWYLTYNDADFQYPEIPAISVDVKDREYPFRATVDREIETTMRINSIVDQALKEKDWATFQWFMSEDTNTGSLVKEQVEEESISRTILDMACEQASWLRKENAILDFYENR
nr:MAG TPA: hypothetical protein [Caudoviricetes sp.]